MNEHDLMGGSIHRIGQVPIVTVEALLYRMKRSDVKKIFLD
jgi:hypothetical protein